MGRSQGLSISMETNWQTFYNSIKDVSWPACNTEEEFNTLPDHVQKECIEVHGYTPGEFKKQPLFRQKPFPIDTSTACQLKWNWSTVYLYKEWTASCHRSNHHKFDTETFDFHNTESKLDDRKRMLEGKWPKQGCNYCKKVEQAGGQSDRITNLNFPGMLPPVELEADTTAINVTPRILEVYFDNKCNLKCLYCGPHFSSLWEDENKKFSKNVIATSANQSNNLEQNTDKLFDWLEKNIKKLSNMNILGGEPLYQHQFDRCLDFFDKNPSPDLNIQIFSNLNAPSAKIEQVITKVKHLIEKKCIRTFTVTASLDCWGPSAELARFPLKLSVWEKNFKRLLQEDFIQLVIGSTITPVTVGTLYQLFEKIQEFDQTRKVHRYFNSTLDPDFMRIDIFGDVFSQHFDKAIDIYEKQSNNEDDRNILEYLKGISIQSKSKLPDVDKVRKLYDFLERMDYRRGTNWRTSCPWLVTPFEKILNDHGN